jgi:hypothetical protein
MLNASGSSRLAPRTAASQALDQPPPGLRHLPNAAIDWSLERQQVAHAQRMPNLKSMLWLRSLPTELQPVKLMRHYARVANSLAQAWDDGDRCERMLSELLQDNRGGRRGFPQPVMQELHALAQHLMWRQRARVTTALTRLALGE